MSVRVELTYDMGKALGEARFDVEATKVEEVVAAARARFADAEQFAKLSARTAIAVNGVLVRYRERLETPLADGDRVSFVKAAAGG